MALPIGFDGAAGTVISTYDAGFSRLSGDTGTLVLNGTGGVRRGGTAGCQYTWSTDLPPSADYWVEAPFLIDSNNVLERFGICGRASSSARTFYYARIRTTASNPDGFVELYKFVSGTATQLGSSYTININGDPTYLIRLEMIGSAIKVYVDGVERISATDSAITTAGRIGLYCSADAATPSNTTGLQILSLTTSFAAVDVEASGDPSSVIITAPTGSAASLGGDVEASGDPSGVSVTAPTGAASAGNPLALAEFFGSNVDLANSVITNGSTDTPAVDIAIRNPEGGTPIWQHFRFALVNDSGVTKTAAISINLANQEGSTTIRSTWPGPYRANTLTDIDAWSAIARSETGGVLHFDVVLAPGETAYICSMPPGIRLQAEDWIAKLITAYPGWVHDDLPSRVALGSTAYKCDTAPTVLDELGRTISGEPMMGFRVGNDAVGVPSLKPEICLFAMLHPGEDHGFIQLRGFMDKWLTDVAFATVRNSFNLVVRPIGAPNGTKGGYRRYEPRAGFSDGDNLNREWKPSSLNGTAQKWQTLLNTDHGTTFPRVRALVDFHDLSSGSQVAFYYYRAESPNITALRSVVEAAIPGIASTPSTNDSTTTDYFVNTKGVGPAMTAEVSDQSASLPGFMAVGAGWASTVKGWFEAGLLGADAIAAPAGVNVTAPTGNASAGGADVEASGTPDGVDITAPTGSVSLGGSDVEAGGTVAGVAISAPDGIASTSVEAAGDPSPVSITAPGGSISAGATANGAPSSVTIAAPSGLANGGNLVIPEPVPQRTMIATRSVRRMVA